MIDVCHQDLRTAHRHHHHSRPHHQFNKTTISYTANMEMEFVDRSMILPLDSEQASIASYFLCFCLNTLATSIHYNECSWGQLYLLVILRSALSTCHSEVSFIYLSFWGQLYLLVIRFWSDVLMNDVLAQFLMLIKTMSRAIWFVKDEAVRTPCLAHTAVKNW